MKAYTNKYSFLKGYGQVMNKDVDEVRRRIMEALNISSTQGFRYRLIGRYEPKASEKEAIEAIFNEYGITDIWGS